MLKKGLATPGSRVEIRTVIKDGISKDGFVDHVSIWNGGGIGWMTGNEDKALPGDILTIVRGPRRINGINLVEVDNNGVAGYVYWCQLRISADHV